MSQSNLPLGYEPQRYSGLLALPTEVHLQIASWLEPRVLINKHDGRVSLSYQGSDATAHDTIVEHYTQYRDLFAVSLTCKSLVHVANTILYKRVSLLSTPASIKTAVNGSAWRFLRFLQTVSTNPKLAECVREVAFCFTKDAAVSNVDFSSGAESDIIIQTLFGPNNPYGIKQTLWRQKLSAPTEAMICSLILLSLPKLAGVALHARGGPHCDHWDLLTRWSRHHREQNTAFTEDIARLCHGLAATKIKKLYLSPGLGGLDISRIIMPTLTSLELDYSGQNNFVPRGKELISSVTKLSIRGLRADHSPASSHVFRSSRRMNTVCQELQLLLTKFCNLQSIHLETGTKDFLDTIIARGPSHHLDTIELYPEPGSLASVLDGFSMAHDVAAKISAGRPTFIRHVKIHCESGTNASHEKHIELCIPSLRRRMASLNFQVTIVLPSKIISVLE